MGHSCPNRWTNISTDGSWRLMGNRVQMKDELRSVVDFKVLNPDQRRKADGYLSFGGKHRASCALKSTKVDIAMLPTEFSTSV